MKSPMDLFPIIHNPEAEDKSEVLLDDNDEERYQRGWHGNYLLGVSLGHV